MALKNENHDDLTLFKNRLWKLMEQNGLDTQDALAEQLAISGYVVPGSRLPKDEYYPEEYIFKRKVGAIVKKVQLHLRSDTAECLSGEYAMAYSKLFGCSYDYLYGMDTCTTKTNQFIHDETGLSDEAITTLKKEKLHSLINALMDNERAKRISDIFCEYYLGYPNANGVKETELKKIRQYTYDQEIRDLFIELRDDPTVKKHFTNLAIYSFYGERIVDFMRDSAQKLHEIPNLTEDEEKVFDEKIINLSTILYNIAGASVDLINTLPEIPDTSTGINDHFKWLDKLSKAINKVNE